MSIMHFYVFLSWNVKNIEQAFLKSLLFEIEMPEVNQGFFEHLIGWLGYTLDYLYSAKCIRCPNLSKHEHTISLWFLFTWPVLHWTTHESPSLVPLQAIEPFFTLMFGAIQVISPSVWVYCVSTSKVPVTSALSDSTGTLASMQYWLLGLVIQMHSSRGIEIIP